MRRGAVVPMTIVALMAGAACGGGSDRDGSDAKADTTRQAPAASTGEDEPVGQPVAPTASTVSVMNPECVEVYGPDTLAWRGFAFDGTLTALDPATPDPATPHGPDGTVARLTFRVDHWYRGPGTATIGLRSTGLGLYATPDGFQAHVGDRLLVSGQEDIAWVCGFSRPWSAETAAEWALVFGQR